MVDVTNSTILNPGTLLNYLPPDEATQFEVVRNVYIAVLGATTADILSHIPEDIAIIRRRRGLITSACFALTRIFVATYVALWVAVFTRPVPDCHGITIVMDILCILTMATTSFLFLRRVQAVYASNRTVYWTFALLWAGSSVAAVLLVPGAESEHLQGTGYCLVYLVRSYVAIASFMPAVFDTLVFFAISYKLAFQNPRNLESNQSRVTWLFSGKTLPMLSRAILRGGQQYYLITFGFNVVSGVFSFQPSGIPPMYRVLFSAPATALAACLACRVHRIMVEAYYDDEGGLPTFSGIYFTSASNQVMQRSTIHHVIPDRSTHGTSSDPVDIKMGNEPSKGSSLQQMNDHMSG
ncbi:hypothetical protein P691DRAFT_702467 [Macrolepiota fuliginosa MF-IS2]|uniref:Transmembrane protein n=1 Tax=Macrolepiota fuliginosa MF-IS2 TaxID=1400762 RepID=A0A9P5XEF6_9AGAR|nr:hypothetical protein P691DRAFT_702467 [Macrolepiota fuliginosa MF-IS2]